MTTEFALGIASSIILFEVDKKKDKEKWKLFKWGKNKPSDCDSAPKNGY
tara:strand:+ start:357 stop:503 length:147 start_codon:yes stop_codon:yes gene_type:complete